MKTDNQVFGERLSDCSIIQQPHLLPGVHGGSGRSALQHLCTTSSGTTTPTGAMSTSATGSGAAGYVVVHPLFSAIKIMIISIVYMFLTIRSHVHMFDVTNILIIFFWVKLVLKLSKFLTIQKPAGRFSVVGFAGMLKPNIFEGTYLKALVWFWIIDETFD